MGSIIGKLCFFGGVMFLWISCFWWLSTDICAFEGSVTSPAFRTGFSKERVSFNGCCNCQLVEMQLVSVGAQWQSPCSCYEANVCVGLLWPRLWKSYSWQPQVRLLGSSEVKAAAVLFYFVAHGESSRRGDHSWHLVW